MLAKQLKFSDGNISLMGNRVTIFNADLFSDYTLRINDSPEKVSELYDSVKLSFRAGFAKTVGVAYHFSFNDYFKWMTDLTGLTGWGKVTWLDLDQEGKRGIVFVENSPIAEDLIGKVKSPIDHVLRGFIAGGASAAFNADMDVIEEECFALGAAKCKFIIKLAKPK